MGQQDEEDGGQGRQGTLHVSSPTFALDTDSELRWLNSGMSLSWEGAPAFGVPVLPEPDARDPQSAFPESAAKYNRRLQRISRTSLGQCQENTCHHPCGDRSAHLYHVSK